ncbi:hypothetical protein M9H77_18123 [Catharanthus roseus]|uniref:Uncharacterized protein n=1 Tax=Catharanthus roseus TaxID=4058 RepID=A0ACC0B6H9_CATRO|nr:hypothetical protein M9H77_18123 [Catharanthus roseus]
MGMASLGQAHIGWVVQKGELAELKAWLHVRFLQYRSSLIFNLHIRHAMNIEPRGLLREIFSFSSTQEGADKPAWITGDSYKNGGKVNSTRRYSWMDVDPSGRDNHSGPRKGGNHSQERKGLS